MYSDTLYSSSVKLTVGVFVTKLDFSFLGESSSSLRVSFSGVARYLVNLNIWVSRYSYSQISWVLRQHYSASIYCEGSSSIIKVLPKFIKYEFWNADMETMKLRSHIGTDGILQIQTPTDLKDTFVEVVLVIQPLADAEVAQAQYNAWGKPTTKKSISNAIARMEQLRREVALDKTSIRSMIEEGRRF